MWTVHIASMPPSGIGSDYPPRSGTSPLPLPRRKAVACPHEDGNGGKNAPAPPLSPRKMWIKPRQDSESGWGEAESLPHSPDYASALRKCAWEGKGTGQISRPGHETISARESVWPGKSALSGKRVGKHGTVGSWECHDFFSCMTLILRPLILGNSHVAEVVDYRLQVPFTFATCSKLSG